MEKVSHSLAVFDLDGTITSKDTFLEFIKYAKGKSKYYSGLFRLAPKIILFYLKWLPNYQLKEAFFSHFFKGYSVSEIQRIGDSFSEIEIPKLMHEGAEKVLNWHKKKDHNILILSASADIWLKKWCQIHGFQLICTKFESLDGFITGRLNGNNCYGEEKKRLLSAYLENNQHTKTYGYGDSSGDAYFLELVDNPYLMELTSANVKKNWRPM